MKLKSHLLTTTFIASASLTAVLAVGAAKPAEALGNQGVLLRTADLPQASRVALLSIVQADKAKNPELYQTVAKLRGCTPAGYADRRRPMAECGREMRLMGPTARWALVAALVYDAPRTAEGRQPYASDSDKAAFIRGAVDTLGKLRDPALSPVLQAAFLQQDSQFFEVAAQAVGRTATDGDLALLTQSARAAGPRQAAAVSGLGECKRIESAKALAQLLDNRSAAPHQVANALGRVASAWAWQALVRIRPGVQAESNQIRELAAQSLVRGLLTLEDAESVKQLTEGLMMTEWPAVPAMLDAAAQGADAKVQTRLAEAKRRYTEYSKRR